MPSRPSSDGNVDVDLAGLAAAFGRLLRDAGLPVTHERSARFARAWRWSRPTGGASSTGRRGPCSSPRRPSCRPSTACSRPCSTRRCEIDLDRGDPYAPPLQGVASERPPAKGARSVPREGEADEGAGLRPSAAPGDADPDAREIEVPLALASEEERLAEKSFAALTPDEMARLRRMMSDLELATPQRRKRRVRRARRGERLDLRRTMRASMRAGGDPIRLVRRRRRTAPRRLVMLCDISGSMEPYGRAYLHLLRSAVASGTPAEAFVFATRLTRLTRALGGRNPEASIRRAAAAAPDWSSGTRIGQALKQFNDRYGRRGMARGAVVVILSDGWERADPALVGREMERLSRLAHRIVWVNPRASAPGFEPRTGGMAAALPHCDALVSGHSLAAMGELAAALAGARPGELSQPGEPEPEGPAWASAEPTDAQRPVPMPSGYGPKRGHTTA